MDKLDAQDSFKPSPLIDAAGVMRQCIFDAIGGRQATKSPHEAESLGLFGKLVLVDNKSTDVLLCRAESSSTIESTSRLPDGAVAIGSKGDYWKQGKSGWELHAAAGFKRFNRYGENVSSVSKDGDGNVTVELAECRSKITHDKDGRVTKVQYADGSANEYSWKGEGLCKVKFNNGGKSSSYELGEDGLWKGDDGKKLKYGQFTLDEGGRLQARFDDSQFFQRPDGSKVEYTVERNTTGDGTRTSETVTSKDGKVKFVRDYDASGRNMTRERVSLDGKPIRDSTFKNAKPVKEIGFDENGRKDSQTDYDAAGNCTRFLRYDKTGNVISKSEYKGDETTRTSFDANGRKRDQLVSRGVSLIARRVFNNSEQVIEEKTWDHDDNYLGKRTFQYDKDQKVKEQFYAPPAEILRSEVSFKDGKKSVETFYQTESPWSLLGKKQLEVHYNPAGAKSREVKYFLGGTKEKEIDFDTTDPTGTKRLCERRYGVGEKLEAEYPYAPDGKTLLPPIEK